MILSPCFRTNLNEGNKPVHQQLISFQYDWDNDAECDIHEDLLTEVKSPEASTSLPICSIKIHASPFSSKINKKLSKSSLSKSMDAKCKRVERNTITLVNNKECNITEHSVDNVSKSTELYQTNPIQYRGKSIGMKEEITGLLKLLVIERKKQEDLERAVKAAYQCCNNDFISMKDVRSPNDSEQAK